MSVCSIPQHRLCEASLLLAWLLGGIYYLSGLVATVGVLLAVAGAAPAQSHHHRGGQTGEHVRQDRGNRSLSSPSNLPEWAEPSQGQRGHPSTSRPAGSENPGSPGIHGDEAMGTPSKAQTNSTPPSLPSSPSKVPVDGGLGFLVAAGAGYAVRRLTEDCEVPSSQRF